MVYVLKKEQVHEVLQLEITVLPGSGFVEVLNPGVP